MSVVAVAGGLGDLGRLITEALLETGKYEVYILTRKAVDPASLPRVSPLSGELYMPLIQTGYTEDHLVQQLGEKKVGTVICTLIMDRDSASDAQLRLIRAAERAPSVRRFIPSEFNVEYDVPDDILPYPEKRYHLAARRELARTRTLEYTFIYPGMFMDYFGMPRVTSCLRPLCFFVDPANRRAILPGDGEARMSMTFTTDAAKYIALALELEEWPRVMTTATSTISLNHLVELVGISLGQKMQVTYEPLQKWVNRETTDLATNVQIAKDFPDRFPGGLQQLRGLIADLEAGVALGAFDLEKLSGHLDLVQRFEGRVPKPRGIQELVEEAWGGN